MAVLAVGVGELGAAEADGHDDVDAVDLGDRSATDGREAAGRPKAPPSLCTTKSAEKPRSTSAVDGLGGRRREHGDERDQRHADEQGRRRGRRALRAAGGVLGRQLAR